MVRTPAVLRLRFELVTIRALMGARERIAVAGISGF
jgi:hypothetical protein